MERDRAAALLRRARRALLLGFAAAAGRPAAALMAGLPPDSPKARLDDNRAESPFSGVVSITGTGVYSGVLLGRGHVLTAAHVLAERATDMRVNLNLGGDLTHTLPVAAASRHPKYKGFTGNAPPHDLAVLTLALPAPPQAHIAPIWNGPVAIGQQIVIVGYGGSGQGDRGVSVGANPALKRSGGNRIDQLMPAPPATSQVFVFSFDAPPKPPRSDGRSLGNAIETGLAPGDSGAPAFIAAGGRLFLFGICTFVAAKDPATVHRFGSLCGGQIITSERDWLRTVMPELHIP
jgi:Trypsin-like peptidase domain